MNRARMGYWPRVTGFRRAPRRGGRSRWCEAVLGVRRWRPAAPPVAQTGRDRSASGTRRRRRRRPPHRSWDGPHRQNGGSSIRRGDRTGSLPSRRCAGSPEGRVNRYQIRTRVVPSSGGSCRRRRRSSPRGRALISRSFSSAPTARHTSVVSATGRVCNGRPPIGELRGPGSTTIPMIPPTPCSGREDRGLADYRRVRLWANDSDGNPSSPGCNPGRGPRDGTGVMASP